ncbi:MAG: hypothetical protein HQK83_10645 [Fibrobacteria bacterium]|nr:hypothetical protein [Fibrobacteria bacterium]
MKHLLIVILTFAAFGFAGENLKFSHKYHVLEEELACADCHSPMLEYDNLNINKRISLKDCIDCHDEDVIFDSTYTFTVIDTGFPIMYSFFAGNLKFSHKMHISGDVDCNVCHGNVNPDKKEVKEIQSLRVCTECHESRSVHTCPTFHYEEKKPKDHYSDLWVSNGIHSLEANFRERNCNTCHKENTFCTDCHMGADVKRRHGFNYRYSHGMDVLFKVSDCTVCHYPVQMFCGDCHERMGIHVNK